jgi:hypothetical protein
MMHRRLPLIKSNISILTLGACGPSYSFYTCSLELPFLVPWDLSYMQKMPNIKMCNV